MGRAILLGFSLLVAFSATPAATATETCQEAKTQLDLNLCWGARMQAAEARVDADTGALRQAFRADGQPARAQLLAEADAAWRAYREAHCRLAGDFYEGGSIQPMIVAICRVQLAESRLRVLGVLGPD